MPSGYEWTEDQYMSLPDWVQKTRTLLQDWFNAIQDGSVVHRYPDPDITVITTEDADHIILAIDEEHNHEISWARTPTAGEYTDGPGFFRLEAPQRLALVQLLRQLLKPAKEDLKKRKAREGD